MIEMKKHVYKYQTYTKKNQKFYVIQIPRARKNIHVIPLSYTIINHFWKHFKNA